MRYLPVTCLATSLLLAPLPAFAASKKTNDVPRAAAAAQVVASAPNARLAALITPTGACPAAAIVSRGKGVASATNVKCGEFCIKPSVALNMETIIPIVSAEYSGSIKEVNIAMWRSSGLGCPAGSIDVVTYASDAFTGSLFANNQTAFTIVVP